MGDVRFERSRNAIKQALFVLLAKHQLVDITMTQLATEAGVSRSTLYAHCSNVQDVYAQLVRDFYASLQPLGIHLHCNECACAAASARPFCIAMREAGVLMPFVRDARFLSTLFDQLESGLLDKEALIPYRALGLDDAQARAVFRFQMSGCYAVALSDMDSGEWAHIQQTLDTFIRGGINALRVR